MAGAVQDAIARLVSDAKETGELLHVAAAAERLAAEHGGDGRKIAVEITNAGLMAHINMVMGFPSSTMCSIIAVRENAASQSGRLKHPKRARDPAGSQSSENHPK